LILKTVPETNIYNQAPIYLNNIKAKRKQPEAPVHSEITSQTGNGKRQRKTKLHMGGVGGKRFKGLEYHQGVSIR
jgi:hypothetical protein